MEKVLNLINDRFSKNSNYGIYNPPPFALQMQPPFAGTGGASSGLAPLGEGIYMFLSPIIPVVCYKNADTQK